MLRLGQKNLYSKTRAEADAILSELGIHRQDGPKRTLESLVKAGKLVELGDGLYHLSDEEPA